MACRCTRPAFLVNARIRRFFAEKTLASTFFHYFSLYPAIEGPMCLPISRADCIFGETRNRNKNASDLHEFNYGYDFIREKYMCCVCVRVLSSSAELVAVVGFCNRGFGFSPNIFPALKYVSTLLAIQRQQAYLRYSPFVFALRSLHGYDSGYAVLTRV